MGLEPTTFCMASMRGRSCRHPLALGAALLHSCQVVERYSRGQGVARLLTTNSPHSQAVSATPTRGSMPLGSLDRRRNSAR
jgi:hypothetical protein